MSAGATPQSSDRPPPRQTGRDSTHHRPTTFPDRARGRFNAWFFTRFDRYINFVTRDHKRRAFNGIRLGNIVELGPGVGANFAYLPPNSRVLAVEPNEAMHLGLLERAAEGGIDLELIKAPAEALPIPNNSVDDIVCTLVLCTVDSPAQTLAEVLRVLRPGGTFRFVEHVAAHPVAPRRWVQWAVAKPWSWTFEGCQLNRNTAELIERAGFSSTDIERHRFRWSLFFPVNSAISGTATK